MGGEQITVTVCKTVETLKKENRIFPDGWTLDRPPRVMLLTAAFGDGHMQVASALSEVLHSRGVEVIHVNPWQITHPAFAHASKVLYEWTSHFLPIVYGASYNWTRNIPPSHWFWRLLRVFSHKIWRVVEVHKPDVVLQLFPDHGLAAGRALSFSVFVGVVLTDFGVHAHWFHSRANAYFLPHSSLLQDARKFAPQAHIMVSGIPLRAQFRQEQDSSLLENGSSEPIPPENPFVLLATGGRGVFFNLSEVLNDIRTCLPHLPVYVMCGRNEKMLNFVLSVAKQDDGVHALPFISQVALWFRSAAFAVVKSGGLTVAECISSACPMLLYRPASGQEMDNARFMARLGAGVMVEHRRDLSRALTLLADKQVRSRMAEACQRIARPDAAREIVDMVFMSMTPSPTDSRNEV